MKVQSDNLLNADALLDQLHLTQAKTNWGYQFRFGLLPIDEHDFRLIAEAMGVSL